MQRVFKWRAKRAGGRITIYGENERGEPVRIAGVDIIQATDNGTTATDKNLDTFALMPLNALR